VAGATALLSKVKSELGKSAFGDGATIEYNDDDDDDNVDVASDTSSDELYYKNRREDRNYEFRMVGMVMSIICSTIIALVLISLIFFFLHRRRKYVMVEKAIENNYQLPSSVTGVYAQDIPQQNEPFDGQAMPQNGFDGQQETASPYASQYVPRPSFVGNPNAQGMTQKNVPGQYNLSNFKSSVCWLVVGVIGIFFGLCSQIEFFTFMFMIPFVIGLVKAINEFLGQRSRVEYEKWQMQQRYYANYAQSEPKTGTSGQQNDEGVTPPPFDGGDMK